MAWAAGSRGGRDGAGDRPLDTRELKERYRGEWPDSVRREYLVLAMLNIFLPRRFRARLTGVGAGSTEYVEDRYRDPYTAFDITVYNNGRPIAWVDVTGVVSSEKMREHHCNGRCVGSWKMRKAREFRVVDRLWFAFVVDDNLAVYWLPAEWLDQMIEAPFVAKCHLRKRERLAYCLDSHYWKRFRHFKNWLLNTAIYKPVATAWG
jgi:hypothetical protein